MYAPTNSKASLASIEVGQVRAPCHTEESNVDAHALTSLPPRWCSHTEMGGVGPRVGIGGPVSPCCCGGGRIADVREIRMCVFFVEFHWGPHFLDSLFLRCKSPIP